jgi:hypothetical protein
MHETPDERVRRLKLQLHGWACQIAIRFGAPVYLHGSVLDSDEPRDVDVSVVLPDAQFEARYGSVAQWDTDRWATEMSAVTQRVASDQVKLGAWMVTAYRLNVDFKIVPASHITAKHADKPRVRLDTVACIAD